MKITVCVVLALLLVGCSEDAKKEVKKVEVQKVAEVKVAEVQKVAEVKIAEVKTAVTPQAVLVQKIMKPAPESEVKEVVASIDAGALYKSCSACHGANGDKPALGKSKLIQGWSVVQVTDSLNGYKDGTYGGAMKSIMKGQASKLDDGQIKALGEYISKL
ncbi:c-type cytochrome [Sulfurimonas sp.]|uniref:c-type cytochrome n=1 Tax=Sulfurimonas sp. TaxID=2022749 RepID=UPI002AB0715E|nr:c-type cytochrome [Sulfurimonas sp.]